MDCEKNKEALAIVKQMVADGQVAQDVAEKYFPELAESEDEKMIQYFKDLAPFDKAEELYEKYGFSHKDAIAWLEKKCEQKPIECMYSKDNYTDEDRKVLCDDCQEECELKQKTVEPQDLSEFKRQLKEYLLEEGWNAPDPIYLDEAVEYKTKRLLSLVPMPVEWSKEDEKHYNMCLQYFATIKEDSVFYEDYLWLKSLRQKLSNVERNGKNWKPSEEQLSALKEAYQTGSMTYHDMRVLEELWKKLKAL